MNNSATTVITVGYNSAAVIGRLLDSLPSGTPTIVVDNASTDETLDVIMNRSFGQELQILRMPQNEGFGRACNAGAMRARENKFVHTEFLFFVNPDAWLTPGTITALEDSARSLPDFVAGNPMLLDRNGHAHIKTSSPLRLPRLPAAKLNQSSELAVLSGAALFVRADAFHAVGGFDPAIFLYHEDDDLALRLTRAGGRLWHVPQAVVTHEAGTGSARTVSTAAFKGYHMARSRYYTLSKETPKRAFWRTLGPALFGLILPFNLASPRRRAKYLGQIKGAWSTRTDKGIYHPP